MVGQGEGGEEEGLTRKIEEGGEGGGGRSRRGRGRCVMCRVQFSLSLVVRASLCCS